MVKKQNILIMIMPLYHKCLKHVTYMRNVHNVISKWSDYLDFTFI